MRGGEAQACGRDVTRVAMLAGCTSLVDRLSRPSGPARPLREAAPMTESSDAADGGVRQLRVCGSQSLEIIASVVPRAAIEGWVRGRYSAVCGWKVAIGARGYVGERGRSGCSLQLMAATRPLMRSGGSLVSMQSGRDPGVYRLVGLRGRDGALARRRVPQPGGWSGAPGRLRWQRWLKPPMAAPSCLECAARASRSSPALCHAGLSRGGFVVLAGVHRLVAFGRLRSALAPPEPRRCAPLRGFAPGPGRLRGRSSE